MIMTTGPLVSLAPMLIWPLLEIYEFTARADMPYADQLDDAYCRILVDEGLIQETTSSVVELKDFGWEVTKRGEVYIEALVATRLPIQEWIVPGA